MLPSRSVAVSLFWSILVLAAGGALAAVAAFATDHSADLPTLSAVAILFVREASKWLDKWDATRGKVIEAPK